MTSEEQIPFDLISAYRAICAAHQSLLHEKRLLEGRDPRLEGEIRIDAHISRIIEDAHALLDRIMESPLALEGAIESLSVDLVSRFPKANPGMVTMRLDSWRMLTNTLRPEEFEVLVSRGLGLGPDLPEVFNVLEQMRMGTPGKARKYAEIIGRDIGAVQQYRDSGEPAWFYPGVLQIRTEFFAPWMKAQVTAFPNDTADAIWTARTTCNVDTLLKLHLAGAPAHFFNQEPAYDPAIEELIGKMTSHHGQLEIRARTGDLAQYLTGEPIETWEV